MSKAKFKECIDGYTNEMVILCCSACVMEVWGDTEEEMVNIAYNKLGWRAVNGAPLCHNCMIDMGYKKKKK